MGENALLIPEMWRKWLVYLQPEGNRQSNNHTSITGIDELQQKATTAVRPEQETEATVQTDSPNLDNRRLKKHCLV